MPLLSVRNVTRRFGGIVAVDNVSLDVEAGRIVGLIGPNGAGKTTLFNLITRLYRPDEGDLWFDGHSLLRTSPHGVIALGIARTFQNVELFRSMTVLENVLVGGHSRGWLAHRRTRLRALEVLDYMGLGAVAHRPVVGLPFGTLKRVETARALVSEPKLLLLDEPAGGLNHEEVAALADFIRRVQADFAATILLVEHHMNLVMGVSDEVNVLDFGEKIASGAPHEVRANPLVVEAYLGEDDELEA
jgi:branched-chain amino acid transport system ATP-binding protein